MLMPAQALAMAGAAGVPLPDPTGPKEVEAVQRALTTLALVLPIPIPTDCQPVEIADGRALVRAARTLTKELDSPSHPDASAAPDGALLHGGGLEDPAAAGAFLAGAIQQVRPPLEHWLKDARGELAKLSVIVGPAQHQAVAVKLAQTAAALANQAAAMAKKHLVIVRAVLGAWDGMAAPFEVLEKLRRTGLAGRDGTSRLRRPFTLAEAPTLFAVSRQQRGRTLWIGGLCHWDWPAVPGSGIRAAALALLPSPGPAPN